MSEVRGPYIGMKIPEDLCFTTDMGSKCFREYRGKWLLLHSYPGNFRPVCVTEIVELSLRFEEFKKRGVEVLGLSVDSVYSHIEWKRQIEQMFGVKVPFPIIADVDMKIASLFNAVPPGQTMAVRVSVIVDPGLKVVWFAAYPYNNGRNVDEILRIIDAIQFNFNYGYATPVNWRPGDPVIVPPPTTVEAAEKRMKESGIECKTWWLCQKKYELIEL